MRPPTAACRWRAAIFRSPAFAARTQPVRSHRAHNSACTLLRHRVLCALRRLRRLLQELVDVAGQNRLAILAERAQLHHKIAYRRAVADFLRVVGGEDDARGRDFDQCAPYGAHGPAEARGIEHDVVPQVMVEVALRPLAVAGVVGGPPEVLVLIRPDAAEQRGYTA